MYHTRFTYPKSPWLERDGIMAGEMPRIISDDSQNPWLWFCNRLRILADKRLQLIDTWVFDYWIWFTLQVFWTVLWSEIPGFQNVLGGSFEWKDYHYGHVWWRLQFMKTSLTARLSKSEGNHPYISFHLFVGDFFLPVKGCTLRGSWFSCTANQQEISAFFLANKRQTYYPGN